MIKYIQKRYQDKATVIRALAHAEACGLITSFFTRYSIYGFFFALSGIAVELHQKSNDPEYDVKDGICDALEWLLGGLVFGYIFYVTRG